MQSAGVTTNLDDDQCSPPSSFSGSILKHTLADASSAPRREMLACHERHVVKKRSLVASTVEDHV